MRTAVTLSSSDLRRFSPEALAEVYSLLPKSTGGPDAAGDILSNTEESGPLPRWWLLLHSAAASRWSRWVLTWIVVVWILYPNSAN